MISPEVFERYAQKQVPRYTSYPTAPNFSSSLGGGEYRQWLGALTSNEPASVYLHIPFCREMCWYCGCHTSVTRRLAPVSRYVAALLSEIELVASKLKSRLTIGHLHWGGGSPTLLEYEQIEDIHRALSTHFNLDLSSEHAVEVDPRTLTEPVASAFVRAGVNRASLGVQTFDPAVQAAINRVQDFPTVASAVTLLRNHGIRAINFDLIYGLPFQSVQSCLETLEQALALKPDRLAVFGYAHVPSFKPHQRKIDPAILPKAMERREQALAIAEGLTRAGYRKIGLDHFAHENDTLAAASESGSLHRNFQGYTTDRCETLIGFGASAIGRLPGGFVQNTARIFEYERKIQGGELAISRGCALSEDDNRRAEIIEQLMCNYRAYTGSIEAPLDQLELDGLIRRSGRWIEVTDEARPLVRTVAAAFDAYLPNSGASHVAAV